MLRLDGILTISRNGTERPPVIAVSSPSRRNVLLIAPRFDFPSFWSLDAACKIAGKRRTHPPLGLITVAALLPRHWSVQLVDRSAEELTDDQLDWADLVMTGGMLPQRPDTLRVIGLCRARGKPVAVGGPDVTSSPQVFESANFRVLGEAEGVIGEFLEAWLTGTSGGVFQAEKYTVDVTASPLPRFDLINFSYYVAMAVQFSRGCPFTCEFCDIIELYGRVPRTKTTKQMLCELDALYELGYRGNIDFIDDNLIGNKKAVKEFLPELISWQQKRGFPFTFATQASINLADDPVLLQLMRAANFRLIFIGIESPDTDTLVSAQKKQNIRRELVDSIGQINRAGMVVHAGFIIGFDSERHDVATGMIAYIGAAALPVCMVGMLTALPDTQLSRRLVAEGRLMPEQDFDFYRNTEAGDQCTGGLNFATVRPRRDILQDYRTILESIYTPEAFFARVRTVCRLLDIPKHKSKLQASVVMSDMRALARIVWWLVARQPRVATPFLRTVASCVFQNPRAVKTVIVLTAMYLHVGAFSRHVVAYLDREIAKIDAGEIIPRRHAALAPSSRHSVKAIGRIPAEVG